MPKRVNNIFMENLKFKYMYDAYYRSSKGKHYNKEVILYEMNLAENILDSLKSLYNDTYKIGKYNKFKITIPKERIIEALPFKDRVIQQWYVEQFIKPIFIPKMIKDSYACLPGRGVHKAVKTLKRYMYNTQKSNKNAYVLKCDISKFFYSIDKEILYQIISRKVKDQRFLKMTKQYIYDTEEREGIPIGNYTSQYFANIYLNELDHFIKEKCKIKYYIRYVDDFVLILNDKKECIKMKNEIVEFLKKKLKLKLNKKTSYTRVDEGINFLGYKVYYSHILLKKSNKTKIYKRVRNFNKFYKRENFNQEKATRSIVSWIAHAHNADTYKLINDVIYRCDWIYNEKVDYYRNE